MVAVRVEKYGDVMYRCVVDDAVADVAWSLFR
jgi:hypothetical protein